jgi:hypothetical protein
MPAGGPLKKTHVAEVETHNQEIHDAPPIMASWIWLMARSAILAQFRRLTASTHATLGARSFRFAVASSPMAVVSTNLRDLCASVLHISSVTLYEDEECSRCKWDMDDNERGLPGSLVT